MTELSKLEHHIKELATTLSYEERIGYITSVLDQHGISYEKQVLPRKWWKTPLRARLIPKKWRKKWERKQVNIVVDLPGNSEKTVYIAHNDTDQGFDLFNFKNKGVKYYQHGANDNASGVSKLLENLIEAHDNGTENRTYLFAGSEEGSAGTLLKAGATGVNIMSGIAIGTVLATSPNLYGGILNTAKALGWELWAPFLATLPFAFPYTKLFDRFRIGTLGSKHYVNSLSKEERKNIKGAISVDMVAGENLHLPKRIIGMNALRLIIPHKSDQTLNEILAKAIVSEGKSFSPVFALGTSDQVSFIEKGIPGAMLFSDVDNIFTGIHTTRDRPENLNLETLEASIGILRKFQLEFEYGEKIEYEKKADLVGAQIYSSKDKNYAILSYQQDKNLVHVLNQVEREEDTFRVTETLDFLVDGGKRRLLKGLKTRKVRLKEFEISDGETSYQFSKSSLLRKSYGALKSSYGYVQQRIGTYFLPSIIALNSYFVYTVQNGIEQLSPEQANSTYTLIMTGILGAVTGIGAVISYPSFVRRAQENVVSGNVRQLPYQPTKTE